MSATSDDLLEIPRRLAAVPPVFLRGLRVALQASDGEDKHEDESFHFLPLSARFEIKGSRLELNTSLELFR